MSHTTDKCKTEAQIKGRTHNILLGGISQLEQTEDLKYLGIIWNDHITLETAMKTLSDCGGGALAAVIRETDSCRDLGSESCAHFFNS